jgi:hypothetical protein
MVGLLTMVGFTFCGYNTQDVWCNEALAHLQQCCPGLDASVYYCDGPSSGCEHYSFDVEEGKRIARSSCEQLVAEGACTTPFPPPARIAP